VWERNARPVRGVHQRDLRGRAVICIAAAKRTIAGTSMVLNGGLVAQGWGGSSTNKNAGVQFKAVTP